MRILILILLLISSVANAKQLRVAIVDTGLDQKDPRFSKLLCPGNLSWNFADNNADTSDHHGHGTHIAGLIKQYAENSNYCLIIYKFYNGERDSDPTSATVAAFNKAVKDKVDIINYSAGGNGYATEEDVALRNADRHGITMVLAAGNNGMNLSVKPYYPAVLLLKNKIVVGGLEFDSKKPHISSNYGKEVSVWERGENLLSTFPNGREGYLTGTSQAPAIHTGKIIKLRSQP